MPDFGPFSVDPAQVSGLGGANFTALVNRLIATEVAAHGLAGAALETTYMENVGDGGVDAGLRARVGTSWLPVGDSAWQFKAGDLEPSECQAELEGAKEAIKILRAGGSYRLVLGRTLTAAKIRSRRARLVEAARGLGIAQADERVDVIGADGLARWIEQFPALAVSPLIRGAGIIGQTFEEWNRSIRHTTIWVSSQTRDSQIADLRATIAGGAQVDVHIDGVSGLGKTRMVLEALREDRFAPVVVYAAAADSFPVPALIQLQAQSRSAVVVVDECDRKQHETYAQVLSHDTRLRLVTIGEPGGSATRTPMITLGALNDEAMHDLLRENRPGLSLEAARVVVQVAAGNIDFALKLSHLALEHGTSAGALVKEDDLRAFFTDRLPDGQLFLGSCALALFRRFGVDGETSREMDLIARGLGIPIGELRNAAAELQRRGLLSHHGRFRSVGPHPVAVFLAARGWQEFGHKIVEDLLPLLDADLSDRLFSRATEIGELGSASPAIAAVLAPDGKLGTLDRMAQESNAALLVHFAVLAPNAVSAQLAQLIHHASEDQLAQGSGIRRDLVWALTKLAWHSSTFEVAADTMLRLAIVETETYSNNASGTWIDFFGAMLPGTAATPTTRVEYLKTHLNSEDPRIRLLVARAADKALDAHEWIMAAGEIQGGVVVERRGTPITWPEALAYRDSAIDILAALSGDPVHEVSETATKSLCASLHGLLEIEQNRNHLGKVIAGLSPDVVSRVRAEILSLRSLFERVDTSDGRPAGLHAFEALIPAANPGESLAALANAKSWDRETDELATELAQAAALVDEDNAAAALADLLRSESDLPGAYAVGRALLTIGIGFVEGVALLTPFAGSPNGEALIGFLHGLQDRGDLEAFDRYFESVDLPPLVALRYTVRGTRTAKAKARVDLLVRQSTVADAARASFAWMHNADQSDSARYLREWTLRIQTQSDYNAAVDFAAMQVFQKPESLEDLDTAIDALIPLRRDFPEVGQQAWDWAVLVRRRLGVAPLELAALIADLVEDEVLSVHSGSDESQILQDAVRLGGAPVWVELMSRLERGDWRLSFSAREWLGNATDVGVARLWVGDNVARARTLAGVTKPGGPSLSPIACFLIDDFGADERVASYLNSQFLGGMWTGFESERVASQISEVQVWLADAEQSRGVRMWARTLISALDAQLKTAKEKEAERGW